MTSVVPMPPELAEISAAALDGCLEATREPPSPASLRRIMKRGGRALQSVLSSAPATASSISSECREALQNMTDAGQALEMRSIVELEKCGVLVDCAVPRLNDLEDDTVKHLAELREAVSSCAMATLATKPNVNLLALWSVVHTSVSAAITEEAAALAAQAETVIPDSIEDIEDNMVCLGRLLQVALLSSAAFAGSVGAEVRAGVEKLVRDGAPLAEHLVQELKSHLESIRDALSEEDWQEFGKLCSQSLMTGWQELGEGASKLSEAAATATQVEVDKVFNSPFATAIAARSSALATGALAYSRDFVDAALDAARDGRVIVLTGFIGWIEHMGLPPLLRVEIARDFFQTAGLFFAGLFVPVIAYLSDADIGSNMRNILWGFSRFYDVFAVDVSAFLQVPTTASNVFVVFLIMGILLVWLSYLWFLKTGRHMHSRVVEVRHGHEATTWAALAMRQATRVKMFTYVITACLTVYLPLTRLCLDVLAASAAPAMDYEDAHYGATDLVIARMKNSSGWWLAVVVAIVVLVTFTITLPYTFYTAIKRNQPTGSHENANMTHNLDGEKVEFTDKVYARLVAKDPSQLRCPYRSLYAGFGQRSSHYKVVQLGVKISLAFLIVCTTRSGAGLRGGLICTLYIFVVIFTVRGKPFTDPMNNVQEISSKVAAFTTCFCAAVIVNQDSLRGWGGFAVFVQVLNLIVMVSVLMLGMKRTRLWIKDKTGFLSFSDTSRGIEDARAVDIVPEWNPDKEVKHRVWQAFWRATLLEITEPKLGKDYSGVTIANRLADLEQAVVASGAHRVVSHWKGEENSYTVRLRRAVLDVLEGVDVFWGDLSAPRNGHSGFGKMYVKPYPYHCVIVYDDPIKSAVGEAGIVEGEASKDVITLRDDYDPNDSTSTHRNLAKLFFLNFSPRIVARREVRQKLRALSALATSIRFPFVQEEEVTLEDGIIELKRFGKTYTETRMSKVKFKCYYTWGVIRVETEGDGHGKTPRIMAEGFNVTMTYRDGQGDAVAPNTGIVHSLKHRETTKGPEHIGLTPDMEESEELNRIFAQTESDWAAGVKKLRSQDQQYRRRLEEKYRRGNETLSDGFWHEVYNQPHLSRSKLEHHLRVREIHPQLRGLPRTHADALDALYLRLRYIYSHPAVTFWYVFWDDVYARNGEMKRLRDHKALLDPMERTSLCYRVMKRDELEACLEARQLLGRKGYFVPRLLQLRLELVDPTKVHLPQGLFEPKILDLLYDTLNKHIEAAKQGKTTSEIEDEQAKKDGIEGKLQDIREQVRNVFHIADDKTNEQREPTDVE
ncbi:white protein [Phytophthora cinnamomi]|uniref:white protein n=1 Tax=Phytophthora cinnamomi TaxID=4785 RepID=UPI00355ABD18|nr:white protein [Phytophthora cinnamomi]